MCIEIITLNVALAALMVGVLVLGGFTLKLAKKARVDKGGAPLT